MKALSPGARRLPLHHITTRVPWHDNGWSGSVCTRPLDNTSCLILPRIGEGKRDDVEIRCAGQRLDELKSGELPPCVGERVSFMAPFDFMRTMQHPYVKTSPETHGHFESTPYVHQPYSAACVPFRWMLRKEVEGDPKTGTLGLGESLKLGWMPDREPDLQFTTAWVQERDNQLAFLDTFFGAITSRGVTLLLLCQTHATVGTVQASNHRCRACAVCWWRYRICLRCPQPAATLRALGTKHWSFGSTRIRRWVFVSIPRSTGAGSEGRWDRS